MPCIYCAAAGERGLLWAPADWNMRNLRHTNYLDSKFESTSTVVGAMPSGMFAIIQHGTTTKVVAASALATAKVG